MPDYFLKNERRTYPLSKAEFVALTEGRFSSDTADGMTIASKTSEYEATLNPQWKAFEIHRENTLKLYSYSMVIDIIRKDYQYPIYEPCSLPRRVSEYRTVAKGCYGRFRERHLELATCALCLCDHDIKFCAQIQSKLVCIECRQELAYAKATADVADYIARKRLATPKWADLDAIEAIYTEARIRTLKTGIQHHVDHFYPLRSRKVQGLHVAANLRIITATENLKKGNKLI